MRLTAALAAAGILRTFLPAPLLLFRLYFFSDCMAQRVRSTERPFAAALQLIGGVMRRVFLLWGVTFFLLLIFLADDGCSLLQDKSRGFDFWLFCRFFCFWIRHNSLSFRWTVFLKIRLRSENQTVIAPPLQKPDFSRRVWLTPTRGVPGYQMNHCRRTG